MPYGLPNVLKKYVVSAPEPPAYSHDTRMNSKACQQLVWWSQLKSVLQLKAFHQGNPKAHQTNVATSVIKLWAARGRSWFCLSIACKKLDIWLGILSSLQGTNPPACGNRVKQATCFKQNTLKLSVLKGSNLGRDKSTAVRTSYALQIDRKPKSLDTENKAHLWFRITLSQPLLDIPCNGEEHILNVHVCFGTLDDKNEIASRGQNKSSKTK